MFKVLITFFLIGLTFGAGPCVVSCGPLLLSYIVGTKKNIASSIRVYLLFSLARILVYLALGAAIFFLGRFAMESLLGDISRYVLILGGAFIILVGVLTAFGRHLKLKPWQALQSNFIERDKKSIFIFGLVIGLLPCAPLLAAISYMGLVSKSLPDSLLYSLFFGIGTVVSPLAILVIAAGYIPSGIFRTGYIIVPSTL